jgi:uncharacterized DUF497 family protein
MALFEFVEWLLHWLYEADDFQFQWNLGNAAKNVLKHGVQVHEIEEGFYSGSALPLGVQTRPHHSEQRLGVIGTTFKGRFLQVVFALRGGAVRPISARTANKKERKQYEELLRKIQKRI